jgi:hypothetical protein
MKETAKEFYLKKIFPTSIETKPDEVELWFETTPYAQEVVSIMIEFAKLHVEAALKAKIKAMEYYHNDGYSLDEIDAFTNDSYPLENIK